MEKTNVTTNPTIEAIHTVGKTLTNLAKDKTYGPDICEALQAEAVRVHRLAERVKRNVTRSGKKAERLEKMQEQLKKLQARLEKLSD